MNIMKTYQLTLRFAPALLLAVVLWLPRTGSAYEYDKDSSGAKIHWYDDSVKLRMLDSSFTEGDAWSTAFEEALDRWYRNPSPFYFYSQYGDATHNTNNSQNEVFFTHKASFLGGAPAATLVCSRGDEILWTDIGFDADEDYSTTHTATNTIGYGGDYRAFIPVVLHELGHALGLNHENDEYNIMGDDWSHMGCNGGELKYYPGEDACDGAVFLYGNNPTAFEDVSVSHWRYKGHDSGDSAYSAHKRTAILDSTGVELSKLSSSAADPIYKVSSGQTIQVVFTYENNGRHDQSPIVGYYHSGNNIISTGDTLLGTRTPLLGRNDVYTFTNTVTLPGGLTSGHTNAVGVVIDKDNAISEVNEANNAAYILIYIK